MGDLWQKESQEDWTEIAKTSNFDQGHRTGKGGTTAKRTNTIGRSDIKSIVEMLWQKTNGAQICIIRDAERMTVTAANALLKTLEEPPQNTYFVLTSSAKDILLPTIVSRCAELRVPLNTTVEIKQYLVMHSQAEQISK